MTIKKAKQILKKHYILENQIHFQTPKHKKTNKKSILENKSNLQKTKINLLNLLWIPVTFG